MREIIIENLDKYEVPAGDVEVHTHGSDGCDGFGDWDLGSEKTNVDLPDHGLSYDCKILKIETKEPPFFTLFEDTGASVNACKPVMRAACNENEHFSTHLITIPIERERSAMEKIKLRVNLNEKYSLVSTFEIDPSKIDLKYNQDQSGLGDRNFGCHLCTAPRSAWFERKSILAGFPLNRKLMDTQIEAERRRINPDSQTQASLKLQSKGVTHTPIYSSEHQRHLVEPLHNGLSVGRALLDLLVRFNSDIFSTTVDDSLKPTYEATKNEVKNILLQSFGFNPFKNLTGVQVTVLFRVNNHEKLVKLVPDIHREIFEHWVKECRFYLGFIFHLDPHGTFNLEEVKIRFDSMLIFFGEQMAWWHPPDYFHIGPAHVIQILQMRNENGKLRYQNLSQTGAQDKENKNKLQREFFKHLARKNSNQNGISDVLIRDSEQSSMVMREHGQTKPVHKCKDCGGLGHHKNSQKCPKVHGRGKLIDLSQIDARFLSDSDTDSSLDSNVSEVSVLEVTGAEVSIEDISDFELEEALADSPGPKRQESSDTVSGRNVRRKISLGEFGENSA